MTITVSIPDEFASSLAVPGEDPARSALEAWGIEAYRPRRLSEFQLRTLLGISSRLELDAFLKQHKVEKYTIEDFEKDWAIIQEHRGEQGAGPRTCSC